MGVEDRINAWRIAASDEKDPHQGVPAHSRGGQLAASTPTMRIVELTQHIALLRGYLAEACVELSSTLRDLDRFHSFGGTSFAGIAMAQHWADTVVWESVLNEFPTLGGIVEIGTWQGGFSGWLWAQAQLRGAEFATYDVKEPEQRRPPNFMRLDIFNHLEEVNARISAFQRDAAVVVFCDGGNKARELNTFWPALERADSLIAVHDWNTEISEGDVPEGVEMVHGAYCESMRSITRFFRRRDAA